MSELTVWFPGAGESDVTSVGGKAASLIRLCDAGFDVPAGVALTVDFFAPWFDAILRTDAWRVLTTAEPSEWNERCDAVKACVDDLTLDDGQSAALDAACELDARRFAVRSSSPDEDLGTASFAGGYHTELGVDRAGLEAAVRACFRSSLDARILHYKREHGFDPFAPRIAVIVQEQVDSDVAGVGFSVNPLTNDYDEATFDASWGLGESVVSGAVTPDHFVMDKVSGDLVRRDLGSKSHSVHVGESGTQTRERAPSEQFCLTHEQLAELTTAICAVERELARPVDIEFAWQGDRLFILQARPITAWVPLHPSMRTEPGERRRLYMDAALSGGLASNTPFTPFGQSYFERFAALMVTHLVGSIPWDLGPGDEVAFLRGGRLYAELSNVLWLISPKFLARNQEDLDALMAATLSNLDRERYRAQRRPVWVSPWAILLYLRAVWRLRGMLFNMIRAMFRPRRTKARFDTEVDEFRKLFRELPSDVTIDELSEQYGVTTIEHVLGLTMPVMFVAMLGQWLAAKVVPNRHAELAEHLTRGFHGNVVVEMGAAMHRMSRLLDPADLEDPVVLAARLESGDVSDAFASAWDEFVETYGWRGPSEVDVGAPRYQDEPLLALRQVCAMGKSDFDPVAKHAEHVAQREEAFAVLTQELGFVRRFFLRRAYVWADLFGGTRDTPKHQYLMLFAAARERVVGQGTQLVAAGRLDEAEDALELTLDDLELARRDESVDLRTLRAERMEFISLLRDVVKAFPAVIDSRGRIQRPAPREERPGEVTGMPISPGTARGPAKVLHDPQHKPVEPGDVLIAHTTDPGWTPLFVNASAIVLEVGGTLQHGAVVAREYGKPCVAGISNLLDRFEDGTQLEVDGTAGVVRIVNE